MIIKELDLCNYFMIYNRTEIRSSGSVVNLFSNNCFIKYPAPLSTVAPSFHFLVNYVVGSAQGSSYLIFLIYITDDWPIIIDIFIWSAIILSFLDRLESVKSYFTDKISFNHRI